MAETNRIGLSYHIITFFPSNFVFNNLISGFNKFIGVRFFFNCHRLTGSTLFGFRSLSFIKCYLLLNWVSTRRSGCMFSTFFFTESNWINLIRFRFIEPREMLSGPFLGTARSFSLLLLFHRVARMGNEGHLGD